MAHKKTVGFEEDGFINVASGQHGGIGVAVKRVGRNFGTILLNLIIYI